MTDKAKTTDEPLHRALLSPIGWCVVCPSCGVENDIAKTREDDAGAILAADEDQFLHCEECGAWIEAVGVQVQEAYPQ